MGSKNPLVEWGNAGTRTPTYDDAKKALGWVTGEPPEEYAWNEVEFSRDSRINENRERIDALGTAPPQASAADMCRGLVTYQWGNPAGMPNALVSGVDVQDVCLGWDASAQKHQLLVLFQNGSIYPVECEVYDSAPVLGDELEFEYPSTPAAVCSLCSDADYVYITWIDSSDNVYISKFSADTLAEVWTTDTGLDEASFATYHHYYRMVVTSTYVAALVRVDDFGKSYRSLCSALVSTGVLNAGTGSYATGYGDDTDQRSPDLVTDGTHAYWLAYQDGTTERDYFLISAALAAPSGSSYTSHAFNTVLDTNWDDRPSGLKRVGSYVIVTTPAGAISIVVPGSPCVDYPIATQDFTQPFSGEQHGVTIGSDGLSLWALFFRARPAAGTYPAAMLCKIPIGEVNTYYAGFSTTPPEVRLSKVHVPLPEATAAFNPGFLVFDRSDLWYVTEAGTFYRICNPGGR